MSALVFYSVHSHAEVGSYNEQHLDELCITNIARFRLQNKRQRNESSLCHLLGTFFRKVLNIETPLCWLSRHFVIIVGATFCCSHLGKPWCSCFLMLFLLSRLGPLTHLLVHAHLGSVFCSFIIITLIQELNMSSLLGWGWEGKEAYVGWFVVLGTFLIWHCGG